MTVFLTDPDVTLHHGNALDVLGTLPAGSVHMCVTSPPFFGLRSYLDNEHEDKPLEIGLEETPEQWVENLVNVFREVRRVLRDDGTLWLEVGDSYGANQGAGFNSVAFRGPGHVNRKRLGQETPITHPYKPKDLIGAPWQLAFALRADGWWLRSDIVWARPNPMPESVSDRPTKSHSYIFLLSKQPRYFFDQEAVREPHTPDSRSVTTVRQGNGSIQHRDGERWPNSGRNVRSVWNIATQPYPEAHFATFPEELARRCILAGTSEWGCCSVCGAPWVREVERIPMEIDRSERTHPLGRTRSSGTMTKPPESQALGWRPSCPPHTAETVPATVLDPFVGSGTVPFVARKHGRHAIGIDLNAQYLELAAKRLQQQSLFADLSANKETAV